MQTSDPTNVTPETEMARRRRANELAELTIGKMLVTVSAFEDANASITAAFAEAGTELSMSPREICDLLRDHIPKEVTEDCRLQLLNKISHETAVHVAQRVRGAIGSVTGVEPVMHGEVIGYGEAMGMDAPPEGADRAAVFDRSVVAAEEATNILRQGQENRSDKEMRALITRMLAEAPAMEGAANQTPAIDGVQLRLKSGKELGMGSLSTTPEGTLRFLAASQTRDGVVMVEVLFGYSAVEAIARVVAEAKAPEPSRIVRSS